MQIKTPQLARLLEGEHLSSIPQCVVSVWDNHLTQMPSQDADSYSLLISLKHLSIVPNNAIHNSLPICTNNIWDFCQLLPWTISVLTSKNNSKEMTVQNSLSSKLHSQRIILGGLYSLILTVNYFSRLRALRFYCFLS